VVVERPPAPVTAAEHGVKAEPVNVTDDGEHVITVDDAALSIVMDCAAPVNGSVALAVKVQVPEATYETTPAATVHTLVVDEATDAVPVYPPENVGVKV